MDYRKLGHTGLKVSEFCLGTMTFRWTSTEAQSYQVLDRAWDAGINFIDTANVYSFWAPGNEVGTAERIIGNWLRNKPREQVIIATKVRGRMWPGSTGEGLSRQHILRAVEDSLRRLQTDYIDLYQTHHPDWDTPLEETLRALDDLITAGKVRYIGASNYAAWHLTKALWISDKFQWARFESIQPHYHLLNRAEVEPDLAALCLDQGVGMIPYSPLAGGFLTGKYTRDNTPSDARGAGSDRMERYRTEQNFALLAALREMGQARGKTITQMALGWLLTLPYITAPIIGANTVEQLDESLGAAGLRLSDEEMQRLDELTSQDRNWFRR
ncbi:MAG TPA: aldo/keto reductase [Aggregatilineaceae bacterium]|nr:aldo/keto reductase [Aggregatilineaceae bacterium]